MKYYNKWFLKVVSGLTLMSLVATACVDDMTFGNAFLERHPVVR